MRWAFGSTGRGYGVADVLVHAGSGRGMPSVAECCRDASSIDTFCAHLHRFRSTCVRGAAIEIQQLQPRFKTPFIAGMKVSRTIKGWVQKTVLLSVSIALSLLLAELIVYVIMPQNLSGSWREQTENGLIVNKSTGTARHQYGERVVHYEFSEPHLRAPVPNGKIKILVLGDSYTFGWLLESEKTYVNLAQSQLDRKFGKGVFTLLNAAAAGGQGTTLPLLRTSARRSTPTLSLSF